MNKIVQIQNIIYQYAYIAINNGYVLVAVTIRTNSRTFARYLLPAEILSNVPTNPR